MQETWLIQETEEGNYHVEVDGVVAEVVPDSDLTFRFRDLTFRDDGFTEYEVSWDGINSTVEVSDLDGEGEIYNQDWGYVVPAQYPFRDKGSSWMDHIASEGYQIRERSDYWP